jgi:hypothetical protein
VQQKSDWFRQPLLTDVPPRATRGARLLILGAWLAVTLWMVAHHVPWRDEVRAFSLMQMGQSWPDMFRVVHGEGHPYLWYILLKAGNDLFGVREVLPAVGFLVAAAAGSLLALRAPFRLGLIAILLFSQHLGFDYSVVSRNYGISALVLFVIAATYARIRDSLWFGLLLLLLCNTNAPSVFLAGAFFLYRMVELWGERPGWRSRSVLVLAANGALMLLGVLICFLAIYPPANDAAAAVNRVPLNAQTLLPGIIDGYRSFAALGFDSAPQLANLFVILCIAVFARRRPALAAAAAAFVTLKLFFFFGFPAAFRHAALLLMFLVALLWVEGDKRAAGPVAERDEDGLLSLVARWGFVLLLAMESVMYLRGPVKGLVEGRPWSGAKELAAILKRPEYKDAPLIVEPDALGESVVYWTGKPFYLLRQQRFGTVTPFSMTGRKEMSLDDILGSARQLHATTGRPVVIAMERDLRTVKPGRYDVMYADYMTFTPQNIARFQADTRKIAAIRNAFGDERYDVYVYPR